MRDFFIRLMKVTAESEDVFTECLAETLRSDPEFKRGFLEKLCGPVVGKSVLSQEAIDVKTQVGFDGAVPDMIFCIAGKVSIGVENKLQSPEGREGYGRTQLKKYLKLVDAGELSGLAFITGYPANVLPQVVSHKGYLCPLEGGEKQREHFMWRDFYPLIEKRASKSRTGLAKALKRLFEYLGFEPPSPNIGDLNDPDIEKAKRNKQNFAPFWDLTCQELKSRGWDVGPVDISGLWAWDGKTKRVRNADINPNYGNCLRFNLTLRKGASRQAVIDALSGLERVYGRDLRVEPDVALRVAPRKAGGKLRKVPIVKVLYPLRKLVEDKKRIPEKLAEIVLEVVDKVG